MKTTTADLQGLSKLEARFEFDGTVLRLDLNDPPGNVLDSEMVSGLRRAVTLAGNIPELRLILISGAGKHFSFGASVEEHRPEQVRDMFREFHGLFRDLMKVDVPTLAWVRGQCLGGGLELAGFCDWVFAGTKARLGQPEIKLGVFAPMASLILPWRCGARGVDLLLSGRSVTAEDALSMGLINGVFSEEDGDEKLGEWIRENVIPHSASSLRRARNAARRSFHRLVLQEIDELEALYLDDLMQTHDAVEGIESFLEKRSPEWTHG